MFVTDWRRQRPQATRAVAAGVPGHDHDWQAIPETEKWSDDGEQGAVIVACWCNQTRVRGLSREGSEDQE